MAEAIKAWQCIGCGRVEAPAQCLGICEDRPVRLVNAGDYERLEAFVRRCAQSTPHEGQWERSCQALRKEARAALGLAEPAAVAAGPVRSTCGTAAGSR
jgi:hypothetical protein